MKKEYTIPQTVFYGIIHRVPKGTKGRKNLGTEKEALEKGEKIYHRTVVLNKNGCDNGGAFWGIEIDLHVYFTKSKSYIEFTTVKKQLKQSKQSKYPPAKSDTSFKSIIKTIKYNIEPKGRPNVGTKEDIKGQRLYSREIKLNKDNKDIGGVQWKPLEKGEMLFVHFTADQQYVEFGIVRYGNNREINLNK